MNRHIRYITAEAGLDDADRLNLAEELLGLFELESYSELSEDDLQYILNVLKGWRVIQMLRLSNGVMHREAQVLQSRLQETAVETAIRQTRDGSWN